MNKSRALLLLKRFLYLLKDDAFAKSHFYVFLSFRRKPESVRLEAGAI